MSAPDGQQDARGASGGSASGGPVVICPFCGSSDTEPLSLFGSQLSTTQHYCRACHTPFERFKQDAPRRDGNPERQGEGG